jgi:TPR repeat protein
MLSMVYVKLKKEARSRIAGDRFMDGTAQNRQSRPRSRGSSGATGLLSPPSHDGRPARRDAGNRLGFADGDDLEPIRRNAPVGKRLLDCCRATRREDHVREFPSRLVGVPCDDHHFRLGVPVKAGGAVQFRKRLGGQRRRPAAEVDAYGFDRGPRMRGGGRRLGRGRRYDRFRLLVRICARCQDEKRHGEKTCKGALPCMLHGSPLFAASRADIREEFRHYAWIRQERSAASFKKVDLMTRLAVVLVALLSLGVFLLRSTPTAADTVRGDVAFLNGDYATAYAEWRSLAEAGDPGAMLGIGTLYDTGHGVAQDFAEALTWYRRAAEAGSARAAFNVGAMYDNGRGTEKDTKEAIKWWRLAAAKGNGRAAYNLGVIYRDGDGAARSRTEAVKFFQIAALAGIVAARQNLAALGVPSPPAPTGDDRSAQRLSRGMAPEIRSIARFQEAALARGALDASAADDFSGYVPVFFQQAAEGNRLAQYDAGFALERGLGVRPDPVRAYVYYVRASTSDARDVHAASLKGAADMAARLSAQERGTALEMLLDAAP